MISQTNGMNIQYIMAIAFFLPEFYFVFMYTLPIFTIFNSMKKLCIYYAE